MSVCVPVITDDYHSFDLQNALYFFLSWISGFYTWIIL